MHGEYASGWRASRVSPAPSESIVLDSCGCDPQRVDVSAQAIAGAAGVVVGSLISGGFQAAGAFFTNRRKTRQARRMIRTELSDLRNHTIGALMHETRLAEVLPVETPRWETYAPQLAEFFFSEAKFETIEDAYDEFRRFSDACLAKQQGSYGGTRDVWINHGLQTLKMINA